MKSLALITLFAITMPPVPGLAADLPATIPLRAGDRAPIDGYLVPSERFEVLRAHERQRPALERENAARRRKTAAQDTVIDSLHAQLSVSRERAADYEGRWRKADRGWRLERKVGKLKYANGALAGIALKTGNVPLAAASWLIGRMIGGRR